MISTTFKPILEYLRLHLQELPPLAVWISISVFLAGLFLFNYSLDFEDNILDVFVAKKPLFLRVLVFLVWHGAIYYIAFYLQYWFDNQKVSPISILPLSFCGLLLLSIDRSFNFGTYLRALLPQEGLYYLIKVLNYSASFFLVILGLYLLKKWFKIKDSIFFGLSVKNIHLTPYLLLLLAILPLIIFAGTQSDFLAVYPKYPADAAASLPGHPWIKFILFEIAYGTNFINVELLFRGFLVIGLAKLCGTRVLIPMTVLYAAIHFGKPFGEAFSSIFGGYLLGILAFYSKNIWGGICIHLGVAWLMELSAMIVPKL